MADYAALARQIAECYPGNKIAAIKLVRLSSDNLTLKDAKELVDGLFDDLEGFRGQALIDEIATWIAEEIEVRQGGSVSEPVRETREIDWPAELRRFVPNQKIEAIKHVREKTGLGLKEAKDLVEHHWNRAKPAAAPVATTDGIPDYEVRSTSSPLLLIVLVVTGAAVAWYFLR